MNKTYEELLSEVRLLQDAGRLPVRPSRDQRIDWAYGNTKIENSTVTRVRWQSAPSTQSLVSRTSPWSQKRGRFCASRGERRSLRPATA